MPAVQLAAPTPIPTPVPLPAGTVSASVTATTSFTPIINEIHNELPSTALGAPFWAMIGGLGGAVLAGLFLLVNEILRRKHERRSGSRNGIRETTARFLTAADHYYRLPWGFHVNSLDLFRLTEVVEEVALICPPNIVDAVVETTKAVQHTARVEDFLTRRRYVSGKLLIFLQQRLLETNSPVPDFYRRVRDADLSQSRQWYLYCVHNVRNAVRSELRMEQLSWTDKVPLRPVDVDAFKPSALERDSASEA